MQNSSGRAEAASATAIEPLVLSHSLLAIVSRNANPMCNKTIDPFLEGVDELSGALARFQHVADELCRTIDNCASALQKIDVEDDPDPFKALGFLRAAVNHCCGTFSDSQAAVANRMRSSERAFWSLKSHVDSSAMKYGLKRLPTELLSRIFLDATSRLKSTIILSHVSKQFRSIVNGYPALWQRFRLSSMWNREQIIAIAERSAFQSTEALIGGSSDLDSTTAIFSFHSCLEELEIFHFSMEFAEEVRRRLGFLHFPSLQVLRFVHSNVLTLQHPQKFSEMPSLRMLKADFLPHNSMARNLVELHLNLGKVSLTSLLDFLSSTNVLEVLSVSLWSEEAEGEVSDHKSVRLPRLVKLCFEMMKCSMRAISVIARKIRSSSLRILVLRGGKVDTTSDGPFQDILQSNPSFTKLELLGFWSIDLCHIPPQVEVLMLTLGDAEDRFPHFECSGTVSSHQIRLLRFHGSGKRDRLQECVYHLRDVLLHSGLDAVQFEFEGCRRFRDGSFSPEYIFTGGWW
ncbi:hypothetical protein ACEPAI_2304 [Sanghuangporus weigelae]